MKTEWSADELRKVGIRSGKANMWNTVSAL
jgi:hypothetical protein